MSKLIHYSGPAGSILLPQGYTRLAYIESTGTLWVDTSWNPSNNTQVQILIRPLSITSNHFFGSRASATAGGGYAIGFINNKLVSDFNGSRVNFYTPRANELINILKKGVNTKINGTSLDNTNSTFSVSYPLYLLALNGSGKATIAKFSALLYNCRIWEGDIIKRDFVPVQTTVAVTSADGTSCPSGSIGLLDLVENKFYLNKGTGTFIAGPECSQGFPTSEYCLVEWLESTGTLWIDTDTATTSNLQLDLEFQLTNNALQDTGLFGTRAAGQYYDIYCGDGANNIKGHRKINTSNSGTAFSPKDLNKHTIIYNRYSDRKCLFDGVVKFTMSEDSTTGTQKARLFDSYGSKKAQMKLYMCKLYNSGTLIKNFIPCYRRSDMKPGLYDIVGRKFYTNQGTGEFLLGPSITFGWGEVVNGAYIAGDNLLDGKLNSRYKLCTEITQVTSSSSNDIDCAIWNNIAYVGPGSIFTVSFDAKADVACKSICYFFNNTSGVVLNVESKNLNTGITNSVKDGNLDFNLTTSWQRFTITWKMGDSGNKCYKHLIIGRVYRYDTTDGNNIYVRNVKLQRGETIAGLMDSFHAIPHNISTGDGRNGEKNSAFHFDGTSYMEVDVGSILPANCTKYTIMMWAKIDTSEVCALFSQRNLIRSTGRCVLYDNTNIYYDDGVRSHFSHGVIRNNWNHYAFVRNGSNKYVYVNGKLVNTSLASTAEIFSPVLTIGACLIIDSGVVNLFVGDMKDIKVFDTNLDVSGIQQEM